jgi:hypothetical protein
MLHTHSFTYHPRYIMFLSQHFSFPLSVSFHRCSLLIFFYPVLLPVGQMSQAWEPTKKQCFFGNQRALDSKIRPLFFYFKVLQFALPFPQTLQ